MISVRRLRGLEFHALRDLIGWDGELNPHQSIRERVP
jgi:hypothetical protein